MNYHECRIQPSGSAIAPCLHCDFELAVVTTAALKITAHPRHTDSTAFFRFNSVFFEVAEARLPSAIF